MRSLTLKPRSLDLTLKSRMQPYTHNSLELTFGPADYVYLPIDNSLVINQKITMKRVLAESGAIFWMGFLGGGNTITLHYTGTGIPPQGNKIMLSQHTPHTERVILPGTVDLDTYYEIHIYEKDDRIYIEAPGLGSGSMVISYTKSLFDVYQMGPLKEGKIKNISGNYKFGTAYTDIAQTTEAEINDEVASIVNKGLAGGNIIQAIASVRPTLSAEISITIYAIPLTLKARDYTAPPTAEEDEGDLLILDEGKMDEGVMG